MQRNSAALAERAMATKEPIYLTRHGRAAVVIMDAEEFDRRMGMESLLREREQRILEGIELGHAQVEAGEAVPLEDVLGQLETRWGSE